MSEISLEERGKAFGRAVAEALAVRGLKQIDLATALDTTQSTISAWINARAEPDADTVFAAEGVMDMAPGSLSRHLGYLPLSAMDAPPDAEDAIAQSNKLDDEGRKLVLITFRTMAEMHSRAMQVVGEPTAKPDARPTKAGARASNNAAAARAKAASTKKTTATKKASFQKARQAPRRP